MYKLDWIARLLVIIGGLNWGLIGIADFNLVSYLFGSIPVVETIVYILVGVCALYMLVKLFKK